MGSGGWVRWAWQFVVVASETTESPLLRAVNKAQVGGNGMQGRLWALSHHPEENHRLTSSRPKEGDQVYWHE